MGKTLNFLKSLILRHGTKVSSLAILHDVNYEKTTAIKPLAKLERVNIGKCTYNWYNGSSVRL